MRTLDELLSDRAQEQYRESLTKVLDPTSWTKENRNSKMEEIRTLANGLCDTSEQFVAELLTTKLNGKSIMWCKIREQFIMGEIELLMGFRDELDTAVTIPDTTPIDHEWLTAEIQARHKEIGITNQEIAKLMSQEGEVENI